MSGSTDIRYPSSASLFQFCRLVLDHKFGGVRVIDQDVGQILGYDPADCSHWKKGKKNVKSIHAMKSIAEHLGIDERLVVEIASGELNEHEAYHEYLGYGSSEIDAKLLETIKKDYYRRHVSSWSKDKETEFRNAIDLHEPMINKLVDEIHKKINFQEAPLYLPEVAAAYSEIKLKSIPNSKEFDSIPVKSTKHAPESFEISFLEGSDNRPFVRFSIASHMANYFFAKNNIDTKRVGLGDHAKLFDQAQQNLFAAKLLTPAGLIRKEIQNINVAKDIVGQLADVFWVSKSFMNRRLKSILQSNETI